jgi:triosephosphate isomerase
MRRKLVVGNWKMNGSRVANAELLAALKEAGPWDADVAVCVPAPYLGEVALSLQGEFIAWGAQDVSAQESGAYTGEVSAAMLAEFGCKYAIVGHSERRAYHAESDQLVADKAKAALAHRLTPIVCVGETLTEREAGRTDEIVKRQLSAVIHTLGHCITQIVVAYEPVWAIGTGKTPTTPEVAAAHAHIRKVLGGLTGEAAQVRLLYGGSVKGSNAGELLAAGDVDGALIGGASLKADEFLSIAKAA